ncbi:MAG: FAD-binding protein [Coriobacteriales bacterium]|jgi:fumarate reductase flavoprotein subunit|nr:FAD-binding protein [Coriobacteriales bacterium]
MLNETRKQTEDLENEGAGGPTMLKAEERVAGGKGGEEMRFDISRRSFLAGAGVVAAGAAASFALTGCAPSAEPGGAAGAEPSGDSPEGASGAPAAEGEATGKDIWAVEELGEPTTTVTADICIIGGGGTGTAAAIQAIDLGLKPVVIERLGTYGGSFIGTEGMTGFETHWTREAGSTYTVQDAVANCLKFHHWIPQHHLYDNFFGQTAETIEWLEGHGIVFHEVVALGLSPLCWHVYDKGDEASPGGYFMKTLGGEAANLGIEAYFNTVAKKLLMEGGTVTGALAVQDDGSVLKVEAPVVILACGGYSNNPDILYAISETKNENIQALGMDCRDGDGLIMAKDAGAAFAEGVGTVMWCGPVPIGAIEATWTTDAYCAGVQPTLWLNEKGERFCREDLWMDEFAGAGVCVRNQYKTFDLWTEKDMVEWETQGPWGPVFTFGAVGTPLAQAREVLEKCDAVHIGEDLAALAREVGMDPAALQATVDRYNQFCAAAEGLDGEDVTADADFGKRAKYLHPINEGPYWLVETADGYYTTVGGVKINEKTQVLGSDGTVIEGLYAGGCDAGGLYGDCYDVLWAPGSQASWAINSGRLAVKDAFEYLKG